VFVYVGRRPQVVDGALRQPGDLLPGSVANLPQHRLRALIAGGFIEERPDPPARPKPGPQPKAATP